MAIVVDAANREQLHRYLDVMLDRLPSKLRDLEEAEKQIEEGLRELGEATMQAWADSAETSEAPPECPNCGTSMRHRGLVRGTLATRQGPSSGASRCKQAVGPA
ncbi:hypothetical protein JCM19992_23720 [Thermostilla marina]